MEHKYYKSKKLGSDPKIKFGTEGWRGIIAKDFNFKNVAIVSQAISEYLLDTVKDNKNIVIGYDTRFQSDKFAKISANIFKKNGFNVLVSDRYITSPNLSYITNQTNSTVGIMITASHNPFKFNGLKIKSSYGGPVPEWTSKEIEKKIDEDKTIQTEISNQINFQDFQTKYLQYLKLNIDIEEINRKISSKTVVIDNFYGATIGYSEKLLNSKNIISLRSIPDPLFAGINPEPVVEKNLNILKRTVLRNKALLGVSFDGDGDRVGIVDDRGRYLSTHLVFPLILYYLVEYKKLKGKVVQAISLGYLSERISKKYNLDFEETSVGFKYISEIMLKEKVLLGGEESGGYAVNSEIPERDGFISALTILEMILNTVKNLSKLVKEMQAKFGLSYFLRKDLHLKEMIYDKINFNEKILKFIPVRILNKQVKEVRKYDGIKVILNDDSWLLLRPSGTEPLIRIYSETPQLQFTKKLISFGQKLIERN